MRSLTKEKAMNRTQIRLWVFGITHLKTLLKQSRLENITLTTGDILIPWNTGDKFMRYHHAFSIRELKKMLNHAGFQVMQTTKADNIMIVAKKP
jgi:hypothetical protein